MLFGHLVLLAALVIPPQVTSLLFPTNEVTGTFTMTKTDAEGQTYVSTGDYTLRPGRDFRWATHDPFETYFWSDREKYIYTNEDERVERPLAALPGGDQLEKLFARDVSDIEDYFEVSGQYVLVPKATQMRQGIERIELVLDPPWSFILHFTNHTRLRMDFKNKGNEK